MLSLQRAAVSSGINSFRLGQQQQKNPKEQQHCKKAFSFLILDNIWVSRGFFLPHMEDRALTAAKIRSATAALLYATAQCSSIYEKRSFKSKRASLRAEFVLNTLSLFQLKCQSGLTAYQYHTSHRKVVFLELENSPNSKKHAPDLEAC